VAAFAVLLFKGDLARLTAGSGAGEGASRATRTALLQPWLVLLGAWLVLRDGPELISWAATSLTMKARNWPPHFPPWGLVAGLVLILAAGRIAGLLSYGPLIGRRREA
jgi:hypothetical protein